MRILLVSTYEMGHQPLGLAAPAAALRGRGHDVDCLDLAAESPAPERFRAADLVAISVPMHTAARLGIALAPRVRALNPRVHLAFYGLYATPLYDRLVGSGLADSVIGGEYEVGLVALAERLAGRANGEMPGVGRLPLFERQTYAVPDRRGLPPLDEYARLSVDGELRLAGYVEASRGCAHTCTHCPLTPVYGGRLRLVQPETVLADIDQLVDLGARHITFGDPDFFNAVPHSLAIVEAMRHRHPDLTFDATIKVEHLIEHEPLVSRLVDNGCLFVTSAFESTNDDILRRLEKGHTRADLDLVVRSLARQGAVIRPTWVAFTPWTEASDFLDLLAFVEDHGLIENVQPVQYALRLLLPPGSPLVEVLRAEGRLGLFDGERLTYAWSSPDPRLDQLQAGLAVLVEGSVAGEDHVCGEESDGGAFAQVKRAAHQALMGGARAPASAPPFDRLRGDLRTQPRKSVPRLTEPWFC